MRRRKDITSLLLGMDLTTYELQSINPIHFAKSPRSLIKYVSVKVVYEQMLGGMTSLPGY
jgi:hypothetical protein